jgi:hypothetical protein
MIEEKDVGQLKAGDYVVVLDTKNVREFDKRGIGYIFQLDSESIADVNSGRLFISKENKYMTNYTKDDIRPATPEEIESVTKPVETRTKLSFKTEDGYDLYDGDNVWWVYKQDNNTPYCWNPYSDKSFSVNELHKDSVVNGTWTLFRTEENAEKWIETQNKSKWSTVTVDGVTVYEGDTVHWLHKEGKSHWGPSKLDRIANKDALDQKYPVFSTYQAAEEYRQKQCEPKYPDVQVGRTYIDIYDSPAIMYTISEIVGDKNKICWNNHHIWEDNTISQGKWNRGRYQQYIEPKKQEPVDDGCNHYKVGQWVVIITDQSGDPIGTISQITEVYDKEQFVRVRGKENNIWRACMNAIRPATEQEIQSVQKPIEKKEEYKIGDEIELYQTKGESKSYYNGKEIGTKAKVVSLTGRIYPWDKNKIQVQVPGNSCISDWDKRDIRKVEPTVQPIGWKVNDIVKATKTGKTATITGINGNNVSVQLTIGGDNTWTVEKVNSLIADGTWIIQKPSNNAGVFNVGDWVECLSGVADHGSWYMPGNKGQITDVNRYNDQYGDCLFIGLLQTVYSWAVKKIDAPVQEVNGVYWKSAKKIGNIEPTSKLPIEGSVYPDYPYNAEPLLDLRPNNGYWDKIIKEQSNINNQTKTQNQDNGNKSNNIEKDSYKGNIWTESLQEIIISGSYSKGQGIQVSLYAETVIRGQGAAGASIC